MNHPELRTSVDAARLGIVVVDDGTPEALRCCLTSIATQSVKPVGIGVLSVGQRALSDDNHHFIMSFRDVFQLRARTTVEGLDAARRAFPLCPALALVSARVMLHPYLVQLTAEIVSYRAGLVAYASHLEPGATPLGASYGGDLRSYHEISQRPRRGIGLHASGPGAYLAVPGDWLLAVAGTSTRREGRSGWQDCGGLPVYVEKAGHFALQFDPPGSGGSEGGGGSSSLPPCGGPGWEERRDGPGSLASVGSGYPPPRPSPARGEGGGTRAPAEVPVDWPGNTPPSGPGSGGGRAGEFVKATDEWDRASATDPVDAGKPRVVVPEVPSWPPPAGPLGGPLDPTPSPEGTPPEDPGFAVSVAIPVRDRPIAMVRAAVAGLLRQTILPEEIILGDQLSDTPHADG
jgi:hypothetical protein